MSRAAGNGHKDVVQILLAKSDISPGSNDKNGQTPLAWAARNGHEVIAGLLPESGVNPGTRDNNHLRPPSLISKIGHNAVVKLRLMKYRVEVKLWDNSGKTPLYWAAQNGNIKVVE